MDEPRIVTDFDRLAVDIIMMITNDRRVDARLALRVSERLQSGPQITIWPKDIAEASQRARERALARANRRPELPRVPVIPVVPTLPRPVVAPELPRVVAPPTLPRVAPVVLPVLPRVVKP